MFPFRLRHLVLRMDSPHLAGDGSAAPASDEARGWQRVDVPTGLQPVRVETEYGGNALVIPLGIPTMRAAEPGHLRSAREWGLEAMLALRHALLAANLTPEDLVLLTLAAPTREALQAALQGARAMFLPPRPAVQGVVLALPAETPVAIGAVAVARVRASMGNSFAGMTLA